MVSWSAGMRPVDRLRDHAGEQAEAAQQHERARVGRRRPFRRDQRALRREHHVEDFADAFVDVDFGGALRRVGEVAQDRRDPFDQEGAAGIVGRPVDRAGRLRIGAGEIERDAVALLDHLERELVQLRIGDAVVLDVVLPAVFAVGDLRQQFAADRCRGSCRGSPGSRLPPSRGRSARTTPPCGARPSGRPAPRCRDRRRASPGRACCA